MNDLSTVNDRSKILTLTQKLALFIVVAVMAQVLVPQIVEPIGGLLVSSALTVFAAGALANELCARIWEKGRLADFGLAWTVRSPRDLYLGAAGGLGAVAAIILFSLAARFAVYAPIPDQPTRVPTVAFLAFMLLLGAAGEEMLFRGYAFQSLRRSMGDFAAILPVSVLFAAVHMGNANIGFLGITNTFLWGVLLGWAFVLTNALWLPIGLHFGWNLGLLLSGVNLSGFTIGVVGYELRWNRGDLYSGGAYGLEGSFLTTIAVAALFYVVQRVNPNRTPDEPGTA